MNENKPRLALDMYVLAQDVKTGVYRVCDELFPRLARSSVFDVRYFSRPGDKDRSDAYREARALPGRAWAPQGQPSSDADILLSPFGVAPLEWRDDGRVLQAHIVYDLIAIHRPDFFSTEAAKEVHDIVASLREDTVVFAISEHTKKELLDHRPDLSPAQVTVIPLAAGHWFRPCESSTERAAVRSKYGIPPDVPYVLSLATLEIRKNLDQAVNAFLRVLEEDENSNLHLVLAGMSGWKLEKLNAALAAAAKWRHRIVLTGFVEDADLSALYSDASCFIYLSRYEGFGLPPLEAMACGTPVICSSNSSLPEVVGDAGLMFDADDVAGAARAITEIGSSPELRSRLRAAGIARARLFDWDRCARTVADTLVAAHARHAQRLLHRAASPRSAFTREEEAQHHEQSLVRAGFFGYRNGATGPVFLRKDPVAPDASAVPWPVWTDQLPRSAANARTEGGMRLTGKYKTGTAEQPLVSYLTVVRNNIATLARTIESVQQQTYANVEHIILDGASTDGTLALIERHGHRLDYFASEPDAGLYDAINKIVPLARGQLICILNSDDWLEPHAAEIAVHRAQNLDEAAIVLTTALVRGDGSIFEWHPAFVHPGSYFTCASDCHNAIYATRASYERSGRYDTSYKIAADFKWIMSCLDAGANFIYSNEATVNYSLGGTSGDVRQHSIECMRVVAERFDFLTESEVSGLYHSFFLLAGPTAAQQEDRPLDHTAFLQKLFSKHAERPDFLNALAWASMATLEHPVDRVRQGAEEVHELGANARFGKERIAEALRKYPLLYAAARRGYALLKR